MNPVEQEPQKPFTSESAVRISKEAGRSVASSGINALSAVLIRCQLTPWDRELANDCPWEKDRSWVRFAHQNDVNDIVVLLSLGLLVLWTIGPLAVFIVYHVPPLRRFLGLDDSIK